MVLINTKMIMISGDIGWMEGLLGEGGGEPQQLCDMFQHMYNCGYLYFYYSCKRICLTFILTCHHAAEKNSVPQRIGLQGVHSVGGAMG